MRKQLLIGSAMIVATSLLIYAGSARAEKRFGPPPSGWFGGIRQAMVQCDTEQQIVDIAAVGQADDKPMLAKFGELYRTQNTKGEPSCVFGALSVAVQVGEVVSLSDVVLSGAHKKAWAIHIGSADLEGWALYLDDDPKMAGDPA